ncbi:MAG: GGDEF domain-containing protein [Pseudomonadota bacterium]
MTTDPACSHCATLRAQLAEKDARIAALTAENAELLRHDALTGVLNQRGLSELLSFELQRAYRTGHPFCFAIIDLDHFNQVNQQYGPEIGDRVLRIASDASVTLLRVLDRYGRLGGEEFGIILPATWLEQGQVAMQRLRKAWAACDWESIIPGRTVTFSGGLTTNAPNDTAESIIKRAEKALQQAKDGGRDRVVMIEEALPDGEVDAPFTL